MIKEPHMGTIKSSELNSEIRRSAVLSPCDKYQYWLLREWDASLPCALLIGLNPSKADARVDDQTIRKDIGFAKLWGCGSIMKGNLYGIRSTDPKGIFRVDDPVGPGNDDALLEMRRMCQLVVFCWGSDKAADRRSGYVVRMFPDAKCLGKTAGGHPRHTLYLPYNTPLENYR